MLRKIENLPENVIGLSAEGKITRDDYERVVIPLLSSAYRQGQRVRFLYEFGPEFSGFTAGAILDDLKVGLRYFRLFSMCAVVSDSDLIRGVTQFTGSLMPIPVRVFRNDQMNAAVEWLTSPEVESNLKFELRDEGTLIIRPQGALKKEDFDRLANVVDLWIETHQKLNAVVICSKKFPGWENIGSLIHHVEFVKSHQSKVRRVAIAADGVLPEIMSRLAGHFVEAEVKQFPFSGEKKAVEWAGGRQDAPADGVHLES